MIDLVEDRHLPPPYLLSLEAPPPSELEQVETALRESEVDMSAFQYVKRIKSLNTQFSASSSTASRSNIVDWAEKLYGQSISAVTAGVKNLLSAGRQLALTRTVEALMEGKPNPEVDSYLLLDPRAPRSGTGGQFKGPFREAVVFMIGGGNYIEYRSLMELVERSQPSKQVIYGATEILNGAEFIQQLAELGRKTGLGGGSSNLLHPDLGSQELVASGTPALKILHGWLHKNLAANLGHCRTFWISFAVHLRDHIQTLLPA